MAQDKDAIDLTVKLEEQDHALEDNFPNLGDLAKERDDLASELKKVLTEFKKVWNKLQLKPRLEREQLILITQQRDNIAKDLEVANEKIKQITAKNSELQIENEKLTYFKQKFEFEMTWFKADVDNMKNTYLMFNEMLSPHYWDTTPSTSSHGQEPGHE